MSDDIIKVNNVLPISALVITSLLSTLVSLSK